MDFMGLYLKRQNTQGIVSMAALVYTSGYLQAVRLEAKVLPRMTPMKLLTFHKATRRQSTSGFRSSLLVMTLT
ncbi:uncharacterized protein PG986_006798 [Apiospora aurea]|uniref:Uncharacterized protein n=1 Tax=Apiospora aurea TaxID=335848 RepID=A0ABR1QAR0_9PEZI